MVSERVSRRDGDARGLYKVVVKAASPAPSAPSVLSVITLQQPAPYRAIEDVLFPGTWRAEPEDYAGRGIVYLFRGEMAKYEAIAWAKKKNRQWGFV